MSEVPTVQIAMAATTATTATNAENTSKTARLRVAAQLRQTCDKLRQTASNVAGVARFVAQQTGYVRLRYYEDSGADDGAWVSRTPIVAWRIAEDAALPVTPDQDEDDTLRAGVLLPDGQVVQPFFQAWHCLAMANHPGVPHALMSLIRIR